MKTKFVAVILGMALLGASSVACAQFGGLGSKLSGVTGGSSSNVSPEGIVTKYVGGAQNVNKADVKMLRAVGLKEEADRAELQAKNLTEGATQGSLEDATKVQTDSSKALQEKFASGKVEMDEKSKKQFADGMVDLAHGLLAYVGMSKEASGFKPAPTAIGSSSLSAAYVVKTLPDSIKSLGSTLKSSIDFAKTNNIPVPKEAADATSAI
jgi:hypothetical protein